VKDTHISPLSGLGTIRLLIASVHLKPKPENPDRKFQPRASSTEYLTDVKHLPDLSMFKGEDLAFHYTELDKECESFSTSTYLDVDSYIKQLICIDS
jgi:hypothetical protein